MAVNVYEGMFILDPNRYAKDSQGVAGQVTKLIEGSGGELLVNRLWEERRLAYPIRRFRRGAYWLTYFRLDGTQLADIERKCNQDDTILRVLFLKVDPRIVDALIAHTSGTPVAAEPEKPAGEEKPAEAVAATAEADAAPDADT